MPPHAIRDTTTTVCWDDSTSSELVDALDTKAISPPAQRRGEKAVLFNDDITVIEFPPLSEAETYLSWHTDEDYEIIKKGFQATLKKASNGETISEEAGYCLRGLEGKTKFGARRKKNSKAAALDSVWTTQIGLWKKKRENSGAIAAAYRPHSLHSKYRAIEIAHSDAQYVNEHVRGEVDLFW